MGFFSGYGGKHSEMMGALAGLGRLTKGKGGGALTRDARRVVSAFMRGEQAEGACRRGIGPRDCGIISDGNNLLVNNPQGSSTYTLAKRPSADAESMEVCIPATAELEEYGPERKDGTKKRREAEGSNDIRSAAGALLTAVGAGVGVRTDPESGERYFSGSKGRSRVAVPGACVRVKFSKRQRLAAAEAVEAYNKWKSGNKNPNAQIPTPAQYAKARAAVRKEMMEVRRLAAARVAEENARMRGVKGAEARIEKLNKQLQKAQEALFRAREKAIPGFFNPEVMPAF